MHLKILKGFVPFFENINWKFLKPWCLGKEKISVHFHSRKWSTEPSRTFYNQGGKNMSTWHGWGTPGWRINVSVSHVTFNWQSRKIKEKPWVWWGWSFSREKGGILFTILSDFSLMISALMFSVCTQIIDLMFTFDISL